jgi:hypothetical protein
LEQQCALKTVIAIRSTDAMVKEGDIAATIKINTYFFST